MPRRPKRPVPALAPHARFGHAHSPSSHLAVSSIGLAPARTHRRLTGDAVEDSGARASGEAVEPVGAVADVRGGHFEPDKAAHDEADADAAGQPTAEESGRELPVGPVVALKRLGTRLRLLVQRRL